MIKKYEPYKHPRWLESSIFEIVGSVPIAEEQQKQKEQFQKELIELMKKRRKNKN